MCCLDTAWVMTVMLKPDVEEPDNVILALPVDGWPCLGDDAKRGAGRISDHLAFLDVAV